MSYETDPTERDEELAQGVYDESDDGTTDWYISRSHAVRALGFLGAKLAEENFLPPDFEQPVLLELFEEALNLTVEEGDRSPLDENSFVLLNEMGC